MKKNKVALLLAVAVMCTSSFTSLAATKTAVGLENNTQNGTSDAQAFVDGIKNYDSAYTKTYKSPSSVKASDFWSKAHTIKYWSSHGANTGTVWGASNDVSVNIFDQPFSWAGGELEFVFLAACRQLDGSGRNPRSRYANAMIGNKAVRTICGYHESAPASIDKKIADKFIEYAKSGESVKSSWILANQYYQNLGYSTGVYCVLTHSGNVQYSRFPGFPGSTYTRPGASSTKILRFSSANPNGTTQTHSASNYSALQKMEVPTYVLKATPVKLLPQDGIETVVLRDGNNLSMVGAEIGDEDINITEQEAIECYKSQVNKVITNAEKINMDNMVESVTPLVMAEVNLNGGAEQENTIAYNVTLQNTYDGYEVVGNYMSGIVDDSSLIYMSGNWNKMEKVSMRSKSVIVDFDSAYSKVMKNTTVQLASAGISESKHITNSKLAFVLNDVTGYYEPTWVFDMNDGSVCQVNCLSGDLNALE